MDQATAVCEMCHRAKSKYLNFKIRIDNYLEMAAIELSQIPEFSQGR